MKNPDYVYEGPIKLVVFGSRELRNRERVYESLDNRRRFIGEIVTGMALEWLWEKDPEIGGPDRYAYDWAISRGVPVREFPASWLNGAGAGMLRNQEMADYADAGMMFWDGRSSGTRDMMKHLIKRKKLCITESAHRLTFE
jgi:hypothetical protein